MFFVAAYVILLHVRAAALDGTVLAVTIDHREIRLIDMRTGTRQTIVRAETFAPGCLLWAPRFSPDGKRISFTRTESYGVGRGMITIAHNDGAGPTDISPLYTDWMGLAVSWTTDGRLWWSEYGDRIYWVHVATRQSGFIGPFNAKILGATVSRDGTRAAASYNPPYPPGGPAEVRGYNLVAGTERSFGEGCQGTISADGMLVTHNRSDGRGYPNHGWATIDSFETGGEQCMLTPPFSTSAYTFNLHRFSSVSNDHILYMVEATRVWYVCAFRTAEITAVGTEETWDFWPGPLPTARVDEPVLSLAVPTLSVSVADSHSAPLVLTVAVTNTGGGTLSAVQTEKTAEWLSVRDSANGAGRILINTVSPSVCSVGAYHADVTVWGGGALNRERYTVTLNIGMPLPAPSRLRVRAVQADSIELTWYDNSADETGFSVERATSPESFTEIMRIGPELVAVRLAAPLAGVSTVYRLRAFRDSAYSGYSNRAAYTGSDQAAIAVLSPRPGDVLCAGDTITIRWLSERVTNVVLSYSFDGGEYWERITPMGITTASPLWGNYPWCVPQTGGDSCLIEVADYFGTIVTTVGPLQMSPAGVAQQRKQAPKSERVRTMLVLRHDVYGRSVLCAVSETIIHGAILYDIAGRRIGIDTRNIGVGPR